MKITTKDLNFRDTTFYLSHGYILNFYSRTPIEGEYSGNLESDNIVPVWDYIKSIKIGKKELPPKEYSKEKWIYHNRIDFTTKEHEYHLYICE